MDDIEKFKASYQVWVHPTFGISECVKQLLSVGTDNNFPLIQKHSTEIGTLIQLIVDFVFHQSGGLTNCSQNTANCSNAQRRFD